MLHRYVPYGSRGFCFLASLAVLSFSSGLLSGCDDGRRVRREPGDNGGSNGGGGHPGDGHLDRDAGGETSDDGGSLPGDVGWEENDTGSGEESKGGVVTAKSMSMMVNNESVGSASLSAVFWDEAPRMPSCAITQAGPCTVTECPLDGTGGGDGESEEVPHSGTIMFFGGGPSLALHPDQSGRYAPFQAGMSLWTGGEDLVAQASGGPVPAFQGTVVAPEKLTLTAPSALGSGPGPSLVVDLADSPPLVTWSGGASEVIISLTSDGTDTRVMVDCVVDGADEQASIPQEAFGRLVAGSGSFSVSTRNRSTVMAGEYDVEVQAISLGNSLNGNLSVFSTQFL